MAKLKYKKAKGGYAEIERMCGVCKRYRNIKNFVNYKGKKMCVRCMYKKKKEDSHGRKD